MVIWANEEMQCYLQTQAAGFTLADMSSLQRLIYSYNLFIKMTRDL